MAINKEVNSLLYIRNSLATKQIVNRLMFIGIVIFGVACIPISQPPQIATAIGESPATLESTPIPDSLSDSPTWTPIPKVDLTAEEESDELLSEVLMPTLESQQQSYPWWHSYYESKLPLCYVNPHPPCLFTVQEKDNFSKISELVYGEEQHYQLIRHVNRDENGFYLNLQPNMELFIPEDTWVEEFMNSPIYAVCNSLDLVMPCYYQVNGLQCRDGWASNDIAICNFESISEIVFGTHIYSGTIGSANQEKIYTIQLSFFRAVNVVLDGEYIVIPKICNRSLNCS